MNFAIYNIGADPEKAAPYNVFPTISALLQGGYDLESWDVYKTQTVYGRVNVNELRLSDLARRAIQAHTDYQTKKFHYIRAIKTLRIFHDGLGLADAKQAIEKSAFETGAVRE